MSRLLMDLLGSEYYHVRIIRIVGMYPCDSGSWAVVMFLS